MIALILSTMLYADTYNYKIENRTFYCMVSYKKQAEESWTVIASTSCNQTHIENKLKMINKDPTATFIKED